MTEGQGGGSEGGGKKEGGRRGRDTTTCSVCLVSCSRISLYAPGWSGTHYIAQAWLQLTAILLPQPPKRWPGPPHPPVIYLFQLINTLWHSFRLYPTHSFTWVSNTCMCPLPMAGYLLKIPVGPWSHLKCCLSVRGSLMATPP